MRPAHDQSKVDFYFTGVVLETDTALYPVIHVNDTVDGKVGYG